MTTILIVEDDIHIRLLLSQQLNNLYNVLTAFNGIDALNILGKNKIDLVLTDIVMPGMDGFDLVKNIRKIYSLMPILMLTANQTFDYKRNGFDLGIDDYMTKPFNKEELVWRVKALLRRAKIEDDKKITINELVVDLASYSLSSAYGTITLPRKEFELLYKLLSEPGRIYTKNQLLDDIWGFDTESDEGTVKTHISRLRSRIKEVKEVSIVAVKGIGYKVVVE